MSLFELTEIKKYIKIISVMILWPIVEFFNLPLNSRNVSFSLNFSKEYGGLIVFEESWAITILLKLY